MVEPVLRAATVEKHPHARYSTVRVEAHNCICQRCEIRMQAQEDGSLVGRQLQVSPL